MFLWRQRRRFISATLPLANVVFISCQCKVHRVYTLVILENKAQVTWNDSLILSTKWVSVTNFNTLQGIYQSIHLLHSPQQCALVPLCVGLKIRSSKQLKANLNGASVLPSRQPTNPTPSPAPFQHALFHRLWHIAQAKPLLQFQFQLRVWSKSALNAATTTVTSALVLLHPTPTTYSPLTLSPSLSPATIIV